MKKLAHDAIPRVAPANIGEVVRFPIVVLLEDIRSAHNVGAILRTADALLVREVLLAGITPGGDHKGVHKSALGAQDFVPWRRIESTTSEIKHLKTLGYTVAALEITDSPQPTESLLIGAYPICLVVGNEVAGISEATLNECDFALELPQLGVKQSLNVSIATAVMMFDLQRRYRTLTQ